MSGLDLSGHQNPIDKYVLSKFKGKPNNQPNKPSGLSDQQWFYLSARGYDINKMTVKELKEFIKKNRPKGKAVKYKVSGKTKRELQIMAEHLNR